MTFQTFTLKKTKLKAPTDVPPPDATAEDLFRTKFLAKGEFALAPGSNGINLATEDVTISIGEFSQVLPAGSLMVSPRGVGKFKSKQLGSVKIVIIKPTSNGFKWVVKGTALLFAAPPQTLALQIGDDAGQINLLTGAAQQPSALVRGTIVSGDPIAGLDGVVITIACPSGMCTAVTADGGKFEVEASLGLQSMLQDGRTIAGGAYPRILQNVIVAAGVNDVGVYALPELDTSNGESVTPGAQAATTVVNSNPLSTGGSVEMTIPPGATVTFPGGGSGARTVSISEVPLSLVPMDFGSTIASPVVVTTQPGGTTISPPADVIFPNPYPNLVDGDELFIYGYNNTVGDWETIGMGTVQNGGTEIFAPAAIGEFAWYFPACPPQLTSIVGLATVNGSPAPGVQILVQGRNTTTFAPATDIDGDGQLDNFFVANLPGGCFGSPTGLSVYFRSKDFGTVVTDNRNVSVLAVPNGTTHLGTVALPILAACGNNARELGEQCDGSDASVCPGQCQADCSCFQQCGNDALEIGEQCDGTADAACPGSCQANCTCPAFCGNGVTDPGEDCDGMDDTACADLCSPSCTCPDSLQCTFASGSRFEMVIAALPTPLNINLTGTLDLACADFDPMTGPHTCAAGPLQSGTTSIPSIGFFCFQPTTGCAPGSITCAGGDQRDIAILADRNIGTCTGNGDCAGQCAAFCGIDTVAQSGCTGFCSQSGAPCSTDAQCLMFNEGLCNGADPANPPNACFCECRDTSTGAPSDAGDMQLSLGFRMTLEPALPCDGVGATINFGDTCMGLATGTVSAQIADANNSPGATLGPVAGAGVPLTCETLGMGTTSGLELRGTTTYFGTALGDTLFSLRAICQ